MKNPETDIDVTKYGFKDEKEFLLYHWDKLPESSKRKLKIVGIRPKTHEHTISSSE